MAKLCTIILWRFLITTLGHLTVLEIWKFTALDSAPLFLKLMLAALASRDQRQSLPLKLQHIRLWFKAKHILIGLTDDPSGQSVSAIYLMWLATQYVCSAHVLLWWHYQLGTCVSGACYEGEETRREGCIAPLSTQYQIENNVECLWTFVWYFYLNVLLFVWVGNETFAHWRQLPGSLGRGVWLWPVLVRPVCGSYAQFFVLLCNFEEKPAVLCTYII